MMHYKVVSTRAWQKVVDVILVIFGFGVMAYTTALTIRSWVSGVQGKPPGYCDEL
jgi:solute carrier family 36 (proton-coupled amino acid transporter)